MPEEDVEQLVRSVVEGAQWEVYHLVVEADLHRVPYELAMRQVVAEVREAFGARVVHHDEQIVAGLEDAVDHGIRQRINGADVVRQAQQLAHVQLEQGRRLVEDNHVEARLLQVRQRKDRLGAPTARLP